MGYIDMHCDTLMQFCINSPKNNLYKNDLQVDFLKLKSGNSLAQFFAIFMVSEDFYKHRNLPAISEKEYFDRLYKGFINEIKKYENIIKFSKSSSDYNDNKNNEIISAFLTIEDGKIVDNDLKNLQQLYDLGVRLISLTWNYENCFGFPNSTNHLIMNKGLKAFGIEAVERMNELGIIVDVSHLSDGGFWDVVKYSKKPFVASHSNCREITYHPRNLTDEMIRALAEKGGVAGINFGPDFLNNSNYNLKNKVSKIEDIIKHIRHFINVGGIECVGIGSDFDGVDGELEVSDASKMPVLIDKMELCGFLPSEIDRIMYKNVERIINQTL
jgi:Zn-dependent dipeptidase, microsomal dipeptidase homolog